MVRFFPIAAAAFRLRILVIAYGLACLASNLEADELDFVRDIKPLLSDACYACHGPDAKSREADLRLDQLDNVMQSKVLQSGELLKRIQSDDPDLRMPPPGSIRKLSDRKRALLQKWLQQGAKWPKDDRHWAYLPVARPGLPEIEPAGPIYNGIDYFIQAKLISQNLRPSPEADKANLIRRVTFDLTGLPPTVTEITQFQNDSSKDAYEKLVDRLLQSERYGEHMALGWLEASRYADTDGYQNDRLRYMWVWRDWLIQALNQNMPYDRFIVEQMAGDLLPDRDLTTQIATGFNRNHRINSEGGSIPDEWIVEYVADRVETMGTLFLGTTLTCARCHDHKYDPISQKDYYRFFAFFNGIAEAGLGPNNGNSPPFVKVPQSWPNLSAAEKKFVVPEPPKIRLQQTSVPRPQPGAADTVMVLHELKNARPTYLLRRGVYDQPDKSERLYPSTPGILGPWQSDWPKNRLGLAKWLVNPQHPLTARVAVNRVWQHYFGTGLVKTSENFGIQGELPTHPQLLDWLAAEFRDQGWNLKKLHKLIVMSATYRQSSVASPVTLKVDPENRWLSRGPRKRLTPYQIRDAALFNSGLLVEKVGGPSVKPYMPPGIWRSISNATYKQDRGSKLYRRSLYTYWRRTVPPPTMMSFNAAAREQCTVRTDKTTTPLQALTLMNNVIFVESARFLAERMLSHTEMTTRQKIAWAFRVVTSRQPDADEIKWLVQDFQHYRTEFERQPNRAQQILSVGEKPYNPSLEVSELAAFTLVANTLFNLDESITQN